MNRRAWIRQGALWTLGATVLTPEILERLTWTRRFFPGADFAPRTVLGRVIINGFKANGNPIMLSAPLLLDKWQHAAAVVEVREPLTIDRYSIVVDELVPEKDYAIGFAGGGARIMVDGRPFMAPLPIPGGGIVRAVSG